MRCQNCYPNSFKLSKQPNVHVATIVVDSTINDTFKKIPHRY